MTFGDEPHCDVMVLSLLPPWPADQGWCVHGWAMTQALEHRGLVVRWASLDPLPHDAPESLADRILPWPQPSLQDVDQFHRTWAGPMAPLRHRIGEYLGFGPNRIAGCASLIRQHRPEVVIAMGQLGPLLLKGLTASPCQLIWYAADELVGFHLSCLRYEPAKLWLQRLRLAALHGTMERLFAAGSARRGTNPDRIIPDSAGPRSRRDRVAWHSAPVGAIAVSPREEVLLRRLAGIGDVALIRNGVNVESLQAQAEHHRRQHAKRSDDPPSIVFWGRLDFEPNVDAVTWFARTIWPGLIKQNPSARWIIAGMHPSPAVQRLSEVPGIDVRGPVDSIAQVATEADLVVLPLRCGGGIKNKLLEAAAMGCPIVASPRAVAGLQLPMDMSALAVCRSRRQWQNVIETLWHRPLAATQLGERALKWVQQTHQWSGAADQLCHWLIQRGASDRFDRQGCPTPQPAGDSLAAREAA